MTECLIFLLLALSGSNALLTRVPLSLLELLTQATATFAACCLENVLTLLKEICYKSPYIYCCG